MGAGETETGSISVRDLWPAFAVQVGVLTNPLLIRLSEALESFLYRHADQLIVNSPGYIDFVKQRGAKKVALIPNGTDIEMFAPEIPSGHFREEHNLAGKFILMYAGAHGMSNDLTVVLGAAKLLQNEQGITFVLVGDGKEKGHLIEQADAMGLQNVLFLPPVPKSEMPAVLNAADACLAILKPVPLYAKVYPNKVFDYMACGKPVVLAIDGVIREVVENAHAGIFVPPGDADALAAAVLKLKNSPGICRQMGENGRQYVVEHFDRKKLAKELVSVIENMV